jgi:predicted ATPase
MLQQPGIHLRALSLDASRIQPGRFPFTVPFVQALERLEFTAPVTYLVGENGCGKSTLLEALACAVGSITVGSKSVGRDRTLDAVRPLGDALKLTWSARTQRGFFMRAEDFFGYVRAMAEKRQALARDLAETEREYADKSRTAQVYARAAYAGQLDAMERAYDDGLDTRSHGEAFLDFFQARFVPGGLYLLDEPEVPLSPLRQMSLLVLLKQMVDQEAQFVIATHSPILMAYPGATILSMDGGPGSAGDPSTAGAAIVAVAYEDLEHVQIMRGFLNHPERYLGRLFDS